MGGIGKNCRLEPKVILVFLSQDLSVYTGVLALSATHKECVIWECYL